jgi:hypothetical protein
MIHVNALFLLGRLRVRRMTGVGFGEVSGTWERWIC